MSYGREESFHGHVHRHPSRTWIRYGATKDGRLVAAMCACCSTAAPTRRLARGVVNASTFASGPYEVPNVRVEGTVVYTNNPPCGAMRGFGAPQVCFAYESADGRSRRRIGDRPARAAAAQRAAHRLGPPPTGQVLTGSAPAREVLERCAAVPLPEPEPELGRDPIAYPGGAGNVSRGESLKRGVGFALGFKNIAYSEGFDDASEATVTLRPGPDGPVAVVHTAAVEYGQGLYTVLGQIVRTELGVEEVVFEPASVDVGSAGSTSASRQTTMTGGAVLGACREVRAERDRRGLDEPITRTFTYHHRATTGIDENGQGDVHVSFAFAAERAVVEVDEELGLVRVLQIAAAQDAGRVMNPHAAEGQVEGGTAQGIGLALMEEVKLEDGIIRNASFTDYLIPTILDAPPVVTEFVEDPSPRTPYGLKGIGELGTVVAPTGRFVAALSRRRRPPAEPGPVTPEDLVGLRPPAMTTGPAPIPEVPGQQAVPEYLGMGLGQQELMKRSD